MCSKLRFVEGWKDLGVNISMTLTDAGNTSSSTCVLCKKMESYINGSERREGLGSLLVVVKAA